MRRVRPLVATSVALVLLPLVGCSGGDEKPAPLATSFPAGPGPRLFERYDATGPFERAIRVGPDLTSVRVRISCRTGSAIATATASKELRVDLDTFGTAAGCDVSGGPPSIGLTNDIDGLAPDGRLTIRVTPPDGARWSVAVDVSGPATTVPAG